VESMSDKLDETGSLIEKAKESIEQNSSVIEAIPVPEVKPVQKPVSKPAPAPAPVKPAPAKKPEPKQPALKPESKPMPEPKPMPKPEQPKPVQKAKPAVPMMPDMASLLEDAEKFVAAEEQHVSENTPAKKAPAPAEKIISDDVFNLEEEQPASADKFQPEEEQVLDIDSFAQSGIAFNTSLRARAAGAPNKKRKNEEFDFNDWANETSEEVKQNRKKKRN
ncbi:MAG: hypothetical protein K2J71_03335, partial [Oscillospiraceae bacterium]|nr:hypothetical protein [Oscillospiraceae bacterium]